LFPLWISLLEVTGHSITTSETKVDMSTIPEDYHDFMDVFSKSKASKLAEPLTLRSQNHFGQRHFLALQSDILLSQEELAHSV